MRHNSLSCLHGENLKSDSLRDLLSDSSVQDLSPMCHIAMESFTEDSLQTKIKGMSEALTCLLMETSGFAQRQVKLEDQISSQEKIIKDIMKSNDILTLVESTMSIKRELQTQIEVLRSEMKTYLQTQFDGYFLWKITDVSKKFQDAVSGNQVSIYSPPFYSSPYGYKMCLRIYLNGDAQNRSSHVSIFIVLMRGEHDSLLPWPFNHRVTLMICNQSADRRHVVDSFLPDIESDSFQRPRLEMNTGAGIPKFVPISCIQSPSSPFIQDDTMFVRCFVDMESMPKALAHYACQLDLHLSATTRQRMVQKKLDEYESQNITCHDQNTS